MMGLQNCLILLDDHMMITQQCRANLDLDTNDSRVQQGGVREQKENGDEKARSFQRSSFAFFYLQRR